MSAKRWATLFRAERELLGEFLDFADQKGGAGPIRAEGLLIGLIFMRYPYKTIASALSMRY
jgi:hypothetical protein